MLQRLVDWSIRFRGVVMVLACVVIGYGIYVSTRAKFDVYPEFAPPQVVIQTEAPGLSPEEVEALVTRPIENAVNGVPGLDSIRSQSVQGLSVVTSIFEDKVDIYRARQVVSERITEAAGQLPQGLKPPRMAPLTGATSLMLVVGLTSESRSPMDLRTFAEWVMRPQLLGIPGVARVSIFGGEVRQLQIQVLPEMLGAYNLGIGDVLAAARRTTGIRGAGFVETAAQRITLRTLGQSLTAGDLGETIVSWHNGVPVRLQQVAHVVDGPEPKAGDATIGGKPGLLLLVSSQFGSNTLEVTERVERAIEEMKPAIAAEQITLHPRLFRPAGFIETAVSNINSSLLLGGILVAIVLFLFLFNLRTAMISITAIPLSLLTAVIVLDRLGYSLNTLTLGGLAIAIGEVVDDAIIDVENIFRRLRENGASDSPRPFFRVVLEASIEVRSAVVYATFIVALVFLPVAAMSGVQGRLFAPLALAYVLAILASLAVALTVTPAMSCLLLRGGAQFSREPRYVDALKRGYRGLLERAAGNSSLVMGGVFALCAVALGWAPFLGASFLPEMTEGHVIIHMAATPGTSLEESLRLGKLVSLDLLKSHHILTVAQQAGRAEMEDDTWGPHYSEIHVELAKVAGENGENAEREMRQVLARYPGVYFAIHPFLTERMEEVLSGVVAQVVVKIFGDDLAVIDQKAREVARVVSGIHGATEVQVESPPGTPQIAIRLLPEALKQFGFHPVDVMEAVETAYQGIVTAETYRGNRVFDVAVMLDPAARGNPEGIGMLLVDNGQGQRTRLRDLADVYQTTGRYSILHDGARRRQAVTCNVQGRDVASFVREAERRIRGTVKFSAGVYPSFAGADQARKQAQREILVYAGLAGIGIVLLLWIVFGTLRHLMLVLVNLPFALVGGILAVVVSGGYLSVGSLVGFVTLFGITTRNSIMMISHFEHLVASEGMRWNLETAMRGALERLVPVLMTALVTALGLLPLALGSGSPGREIEGPMAMVILGGLATSTALNLLVLPTLAVRFGRFERG